MNNNTQQIKNLLFFIFLILVGPLKSDSIHSIKIIGNNHTKAKIILREIQHPIPGEIDSIIMETDRNRIYNLGIFSTVNISAIDSIYTITVVETFRIIPFPMVDYDEGKGFSYGGGMTNLNFRGLNEKLTFGILFGEDQTWFLNFIDPWIRGNHVSLKLGLYDYHTDGMVYAYNYREKGGFVGTGFFKSANHKFDLKLGAESITLDTTDVKKYGRWILNDFFSNYQYFYAEFNYQFDTRDIYIDPTKGQHFVFNILPRFGLYKTKGYHQYKIKYTRYIKLYNTYGDPVFSSRSELFIQNHEEVPPFSFVYIGGEDYVRGYSPIPWQNPESISVNIEGVHVFYQSFQIQHTLFPKKDFGGIEIGIDAVYFFDFGLAFKKINSFNFENGVTGLGFGFRFFTSGIGVIGIDFGFNPLGSYFVHPTSGN